jgi:hypothetical protein
MTTPLEWILSTTLFMLYLFCLFTVCALTFRKGYTLLGIIGIFVPFLWLIGAVLPAKRGSSFEADQVRRAQMSNV